MDAEVREGPDLAHALDRPDHVVDEIEQVLRTGVTTSTNRSKPPEVKTEYTTAGCPASASATARGSPSTPMERAVLPGEGAHAVRVAGFGQDDADVGEGGSMRTAATWPWASSRSSWSRSLNSATRLVRVTSQGAPTSPGRGAPLPSGPTTMRHSPTLPW